jgi:two-component sensor histidine kinase
MPLTFPTGKNKTSMVLIILCCFPFTGHSQFEAKEFASYNTSNGLSDNNVTAITQDRFGYMWIGTEKGLNRFDGLNFKQYHSEKNKESLASDEILKLKWIDSNNLAVITRHGLNIFNIQSMKQKNLLIPAGIFKHAEKVNTTRDILTDTEGNYYIVTRSGFYHFNAKMELVFRYDDYSPEHAEAKPMGFGTFLGWLDKNNIVVTGQKGAYHYNTGSRVLTKIDGSHPGFLVFREMNRIGKGKYLVRQPCPGCFMLFVNDNDTAIYVDEKGKLLQYSRLPVSPVSREFSWGSELFALNDSTFYLSGKFAGLFKLNSNKQKGSLHLDTTRFLASYNCNSFIIDKTNSIWFGCNTGLFMEKKNPVNLLLGKLPDPITKVNPVISVKQITTDEKYIYLASTVSGGVHIFKKDDLSFLKTIYFKFPPFGNKSLLSIARRGKDTILCGTDIGLFGYCTDNEKSGRISLPGDPGWAAIINIFEDHNKDLWFATGREGGCYLYRNGKYEWLAFEQSLVKNFQEIFRITEDSKGNIWIGGNGLGRYNCKKNIFDLFVDSFPSLRFNAKGVSAFAVDPNDNIWLGNTNNGLIFFEPGKNCFTSFTQEDGLPDNSITALKITGNFLWITCKSGIARMDMENRKIVIVANNRELLFNTITSNELFHDSYTGMIYAGIGGGFIRLDPYNKPGSIDPPDLLVENVVLGNDSVTWNPGDIHTNWNNRNIIISFNAINYHDAQDQRYAYRIVNGEGSEWILLEEQRRIVFNNLTSGKHRIEIKAWSLNNRWEPRIIVFTITISPPFWKTWWFYTLCILTLAVFIYALFMYRINQLKKVIEVREKISQDLHDEVGATLSGISMYSHLTREQIKTKQTNEVERSLDIIQQSASDMVNRLNDIVWVVNPQHDSLQKLVQKLEEFATEIAMTKKMKVNVRVESKIADLKFSMETRRNIYLLCKEAINNAVKYSHGSLLELTVQRFDHSVEILVKDNGTGFDTATIKKGNGLTNMQKRADEINAKLLVQSGKDNGTVISLQYKIT